jgi:hypothetical protein
MFNTTFTQIGTRRTQKTKKATFAYTFPPFDTLGRAVCLAFQDVPCTAGAVDLRPDRNIGG